MVETELIISHAYLRRTTVKILKVQSLGSFQVEEHIYMPRELHTPTSWRQRLLLLGLFQTLLFICLSVVSFKISFVINRQ